MVSCCAPPGLHLYHWHAFMNPMQNVSCCAPPGLYLNHWHALIKTHPECELLCIPCTLFKSLTCLYEILSREWVFVDLLGSIWITYIHSWISIQQVSCAPLGLFLNHWHAFMKFHPGSELLCTSWAHLNYWHVFMKSHPGSELLYTSWALFESLTCLYEISSRKWVIVQLLGFIWITYMPLWNLI